MKTKLIIILLLLWAGVVWGQNTRKELTTVKELVDFLKDNDKSISNDIYNPITNEAFTDYIEAGNAAVSMGYSVNNVVSAPDGPGVWVSCQSRSSS